MLVLNWPAVVTSLVPVTSLVTTAVQMPGSTFVSTVTVTEDGTRVVTRTVGGNVGKYSAELTVLGTND